MIRTIVWFSYFFLYQLFSIVILAKYMCISKFGSPEKAAAYVHKISRRWAWSMLSVAGAKVKVSGLHNIPTDQAVLFVSNHQGNFDIPLLVATIDKPKGFVAKIELAKIPLLSTWMKIIGCVFMDRNDLRQSLQVISQGIETLKNGHSMVIFPEGTRSQKMDMGEFKKGSLRLASKSGVPIVPVAISGSYKLLEAKGKIHPSIVHVTVGNPIILSELSKEQQKEIVAYVQAQIEQLLHDTKTA
jgi:1-acyl-sn-glycerol-3-phosphate acyltransferase